MRIKAILALTAAGAALLGGAKAQTAAAPLARSYDCVIQPSEVAEVGSQAEGILSEVLADRGAVVEKGQILATLHSELEESNKSIAQIRVANDAAIKSGKQRSAFYQAQNQRSKTLFDEGQLSAAAAERALTEGRLASYELESAVLEKQLAEGELKRAEILLEQKLIRSPFNGVIVERMLSPGAYTYEQARVFKIAQIDPLHVEMFAPLELYPLIAAGMTGIVRLPAPFNAQFRAKVSIIDNVFDAASNTFGVRLSLPNPQGKIPSGLTCKVKFVAAEAKAATAPAAPKQQP